MENNNFDFGFDLDFDLLDLNLDLGPTDGEAIDIRHLVKKSQSKEKVFFSLEAEKRQLKTALPVMPTPTESYRMLSVKGGFSSISLIAHIAQSEKIESLFVSTFRVGVRQFEVLMDLRRKGRLESVSIITSGLQGENQKNYDYLTPVLDGCKKNGWRICELNNHSKVILAKTKNGHYVIETSSNLNENPKIEQFIVENDEGLFNWYKDFFEAVFDLKTKNGTEAQT